jgi:nickel superoxide dismutase
MIRLGLVVLAVSLLVAGLSTPAAAHCQIPCGIYDDMLRLELLREHVTTLKRSIGAIEEIAAKKEKTAADLNQVARWVQNKEHHADLMRDIVVEYFLQQRIKEPKDRGAQSLEKYGKQLVALHRILVTTMKAKQTVDASLPAKLGEQVEAFAKLYFTEEQLAHLKKEHGK